MYCNKESGFKSQGVLTYPIMLSIGTEITENKMAIEAYTFNQTFKFCKDLMDITAFEKIEPIISLGDSSIKEMSPLFDAYNDQ